jgi:hypothetical protein
MGSLEPLGGTLSAYACYNAARNVCSFFFPLRDNLTSLPVHRVVGSSAVYALFQWLGGMGMNVAAPQSGASGLPHAFGSETVSRERMAAA